jgi:Glutamine cyclotransferase
LDQQADAGLHSHVQTATTSRVTADGAEDIIHWRTAGMNGESSVREVDLETGVIRRKKMLQHADFAEGITRFGDKYGSLYLFALSIYLLHKLMTDGQYFLHLPRRGQSAGCFS